MIQEQTPKKKKVGITAFLGDPGKAIAQLMEDPDIIAKIPEVLAKCPPAAMQVLACNIARYLPPPKIVDDITYADANVLRPAMQPNIEKTANAIPKGTTTGTGNSDELNDLIKCQVATMVGNELSEVRKQLAQLTSSMKAIQDDLPAQIQARVSSIIKAELEAFQK